MKTKDVRLTYQAEEYLEAIYRLESKIGFARTMELAKELGVVPGSITNTIENLERKGLVFHEPYKGVKLTENGRKIAANVLRKHRLAECLLTDFLGMDWSIIHDPACKLEHALSPEIIKPLEKALGHPKTCPHGNPIPTKCGGIFEEETVALTKLDAKSSGIVTKIIEEEPETLKQLNKLKLIPGKRLKIEKNDAQTGFVTFKLGKERYTIEHDLAAVIHVKKT